MEPNANEYFAHYEIGLTTEGMVKYSLPHLKPDVWVTESGARLNTAIQVTESTNWKANEKTTSAMFRYYNYVKLKSNYPPVLLHQKYKKAKKNIQE